MAAAAGRLQLALPPQCGVALGGALLATLATAAIPLVQRRIIDDVIVTHRQSIWPLAGLLLVAAAVNFAGIYLRRYRGGRLSLDVQHDMRTELFDSLSRLDGARQDEIRTGQLVGRSISDLNMVQGIMSMVPVTLGNIVLFVVSLGIMVVLSPVLTLVTVAVAPALWMIALASRRKLFPASWDAQQQSGEVVGLVDEAIGGVRVVKGFGQEEQEQQQLEAASAHLFASRLRMIRLTARYNPALTAIPSLGLVGVIALGGWLAIHGSITLGTFLAFSAYLAQMTGPVRMLTYMITLGQEARASVIRVFDIIDSRPVIADSPDAIELPAGRGRAQLRRRPVRLRARPSRCCAACPSGSSPARRSPWSARPARGSPPWPCCCPASTTRRAARSASAGTTSRT